MADELPTNPSHPEHNPRDEHLWPKLPDQWKEGHIADRYDASAVDSDKWVDSNGSPYNPEAGSRTPQDGRCNETLTNYAERYGERRYCGQLPKSHFTDEVDHTVCSNHESRVQSRHTAEEMLQHGAASKTRDHTYRGLDPWDKLLVHGLHESLMGESTYEFAPQHETKEFDFGDAAIRPEKGNVEGDIYRFDVAHATQHHDRELALWAAAVDGMKMLDVNAEIAEDAMSVTSVEQAQLTSPTEANPTQEFKTIEQEKEHPLNLAYSRLTRDRKELLQYGGMEVNGATSDDTSAIEGLESLIAVQPDTSAETPAKDIAHEADAERDDLDLEVN